MGAGAAPQFDTYSAPSGPNARARPNRRGQLAGISAFARRTQGEGALKLGESGCIARPLSLESRSTLFQAVRLRLNRVNKPVIPLPNSSSELGSGVGAAAKFTLYASPSWLGVTNGAPFSESFN